jgi:hypothetical protein
MWNILENAQGQHAIQPVEDPIPEGWTIVAITANPEALTPVAPVARLVSKLAFRRRFTLLERVTLDAAPTNTAFNESDRAMLRTLEKDLELAQDIDLDDPDVIAGLAFLEALGLLADGRAEEIRA